MEVFGSGEMGHDNLKSLMEMLDEELENVMEEKDEDDEHSDISVCDEYDDDSVEFRENPENSDFFSSFYHEFPRKSHGITFIPWDYFGITAGPGTKS